MCNGFCAVCPNPCYRGELKVTQEQITPDLEEKLSEVFDTAETSIPVEKLQKITPETGLAVVENTDVYEIKKSVFGKEKVRKVK